MTVGKDGGAPGKGERHEEDARVAVARLLEEAGGRIYALALRICPTREDAEDLVQETFLQAYRKWHTFEGRSAASTWLYTIAVRLCRRRHRRRVGEPARLLSLDEVSAHREGALGVPPAEGPDGLDEQLREKARRRLESAIAGLPMPYRWPLVLKDLAGLSLAETAAILGLQVATVKTRIHRARLQLRKALEGALPARELPPPAYERRVCLDLLHAKQEALDRGVPFPADRVLCERCRTVFATLDLAGDLCADLSEAELPRELATVVAQELGVAGDAS